MQDGSDRGAQSQRELAKSILGLQQSMDQPHPETDTVEEAITKLLDGARYERLSEAEQKAAVKGVCNLAMTLVYSDTQELLRLNREAAEAAVSLLQGLPDLRTCLTAALFSTKFQVTEQILLGHGLAVPDGDAAYHQSSWDFCNAITRELSQHRKDFFARTEGTLDVPET